MWLWSRCMSTHPHTIWFYDIETVWSSIEAKRIWFVFFRSKLRWLFNLFVNKQNGRQIHDLILGFITIVIAHDGKNEVDFAACQTTIIIANILWFDMFDQMNWYTFVNLYYEWVCVSFHSNKFHFIQWPLLTHVELIFLCVLLRRFFIHI